MTVAGVDSFESRVLTYDLLRSIIWVDNKFFTKNEEYFCVKHVERSWKGARSLPFKHTTAHTRIEND